MKAVPGSLDLGQTRPVCAGNTDARSLTTRTVSSIGHPCTLSGGHDEESSSFHFLLRVFNAVLRRISFSIERTITKASSVLFCPEIADETYENLLQFKQKNTYCCLVHVHVKSAYTSWSITTFHTICFCYISFGPIDNHPSELSPDFGQSRWSRLLR